MTGDGEQTRDYVYVLDVADAVSRAVVSPDAVGVMNIGTGVEKTVNDIYRELAQLTGVTVPAEHGPARPGEQRRSVLDATRAKKRLGWSAATPFGESLRQTVAWFRKELSS